MLHRVTAVLIARSGAAHLQRTLDALAAQSRRPDAVVVLGIAPDDRTAQAAAAAQPTTFLTTVERLSFPAAITAAERALPQPAGPDEWLWLLAQDTAPEPAALQRLLAIAEVSPSVAVVGPKLVEWDDRARIREFGVTMTRFGAAVPIVEDELDQGQHDDLSDVLGVPAAAMLVRHAVWTQLGGLDDGLPVVDGGLDFSVRARLAGHRVVLAPTARVAIADDGIAAPRRFGVLGGTRRLYRERRVAALHRRLAYAPAVTLFLHWLTLVPLAVLRSLLWLLAKQPGAVGGELAAAFIVAFGGRPVGRIRRSIRHNRAAGWRSIAPLRMPQSELRRRRMLQRETLLATWRGEQPDVAFWGGGAWVVLAALAVNIAALAPLLSAGAVGGGGLLALSPGVAQLWQGVGYGWHDLGAGFAGPSDPFAAVLAVLGSLTFWQPSLVLTLLWFAAMPLAALGAWMLATRITARAGLRAVFALAWAFAPPLLADLHAGRPAALLAHLLLPWLVYAALLARRSWAASGVTAILGAALAACAPSLIPALAVAWLIWAITSGPRILRAIGVPIPALALFGPLAWRQLSHGHWLQLFADPGLPVASGRPSAPQLLLGSPSTGWLGWQQLLAQLHLSAVHAPLLVAVLLAPLGVLALLALFFETGLRAAAALLGALLGLATALVAVGISVQTTGSQPVALWAGPGLSLFWLGATAAAVLGLVAIRRAAAAPAWVATVALLVAVAPLAAALPLGNSALLPRETGLLPAYVQAEAAGRNGIATLVMTPLRDGALDATLVHGDGRTLDGQSTLASTATGSSAADTQVARLAADLASDSGAGATTGLTRFGVDFVLVDSSGHPSAAQTALLRRAAAALDADPLFAQAGTTDGGTLWAAVRPPAPAVASDAGSSWNRRVILSVLAVVFGFCLLLSLPTGRVGQGARRAQRRADRADAARRAEDSEFGIPLDLEEPEPEEDRGDSLLIGVGSAFDEEPDDDLTVISRSRQGSRP